MFEEAIPTLMNILSLSIGGISLGSVVVMGIVLGRRIKKTALTKDYVEKAFEKAVLPANIKLDVSKKVVPLVKSALAEIKVDLKGSVKEMNDEIVAVKKSIKLMLAILSKFSHTDMLTEEEKADIRDILNSVDNAKEVSINDEEIKGTTLG